jgi:hypothetical protein
MKIFAKLTYWICLFIVPSVVNAFPVDSLGVQKKWHFKAEPYLIIPNMSGETGLGRLPDVNVDADPGDIFSSLKFGAMLFFEVSNEKWAFNSDVLYMNLSQQATPDKNISSGEVSASQFGWELAGLRRVTPWLELGIGTLLNSVKSELDITRVKINGNAENINKSIKKTWLDPMLIARLASSPDKKFIYSLQGDIGGFGLGSDLAWQLQAYAGYRFSKLFQLSAGYRIISLDYEKGDEDERFLYNMNIYGPVVRFGFNF